MFYVLLKRDIINSKAIKMGMHRLSVIQIICRNFEMYYEAIKLEITKGCQESFLKNLPRIQMLLLLNYLPQIGKDILQLAHPQVSLIPHCLMAGTNYLKIVCSLRSKCGCSVHIYFILKGNQFFFPVRHEEKNNMCETDLLSLNRLLDNSDIPVMGASSFCYCLYFLLTHHFFENCFMDSSKVGGNITVQQKQIKNKEI